MESLVFIHQTGEHKKRQERRNDSSGPEQQAFFAPSMQVPGKKNSRQAKKRRIS